MGNRTLPPTPTSCGPSQHWQAIVRCSQAGNSKALHQLHSQLHSSIKLHLHTVPSSSTTLTGQDGSFSLKLHLHTYSKRRLRSLLLLPEIRHYIHFKKTVPAWCGRLNRVHSNDLGKRSPNVNMCLPVNVPFEQP